MHAGVSVNWGCLGAGWVRIRRCLEIGGLGFGLIVPEAGADSFDFGLTRNTGLL